MVYKQQHKFYGGVDLHARSMFTPVLDHKGDTVFEQDLPAGPDLVRPFGLPALPPGVGPRPCGGRTRRRGPRVT